MHAYWRGSSRMNCVKSFHKCIDTSLRVKSDYVLECGYAGVISTTSPLNVASARRRPPKADLRRRDDALPRARFRQCEHPRDRRRRRRLADHGVRALRTEEALVFDEDDEQRDRLVAAVRDRRVGTSINRALYDFYLAEIGLNLASTAMRWRVRS